MTVFPILIQNMNQTISLEPDNLYHIRASASKYPSNPAPPQVRSRQGLWQLLYQSTGRDVLRWPLSGWQPQALIQRGQLTGWSTTPETRLCPVRKRAATQVSQTGFLRNLDYTERMGLREEEQGEGPPTGRQQPGPSTGPTPARGSLTTHYLFQGGQGSLCVSKQRRTWHETSHLAENGDQNYKIHDNTWYSKDRRGGFINT